MPAPDRVAGFLIAAPLWLGLAMCAEHSRPMAGATAMNTQCHAPARPMTRLELVFGTSRPDGRAVSEAEWAEFLESDVTPRFPAGLTVLSGLGQWQGSDGGLTREQSKVLIVWHEPDGRSEAAIEAIRDGYRRRFDQESVLRAEGLSCVSF
jgi:hypothetical protein